MPMTGAMEPIERPLPLRLIPRRGGQIGTIIVLLIFMGIAGFIIAQFAPWELVAARNPVGYGILAFFSIFLLIPLFWIVTAVLKLLPGSPYYYLEIASSGLVLRSGFKSTRFTWAELSPFVVHLEVQTSRDKNGNQTRTEYYYVIAMRAADAALLQDLGKRLGRAAFKMLPDEYGAAGKKADAVAMSDWLSEIRAAALTGRTVKTVAVPPAFQETALAAQAIQPAVARPARGGGVIER
jgi:hypothetical protein